MDDCVHFPFLSGTNLILIDVGNKGKCNQIPPPHPHPTGIINLYVEFNQIKQYESLKLFHFFIKYGGSESGVRPRIFFFFCLHHQVHAASRVSPNLVPCYVTSSRAPKETNTESCSRTTQHSVTTLIILGHLHCPGKEKFSMRSLLQLTFYFFYGIPLINRIGE